MTAATIERLLRRDRIVVVGCLLLLTGLAWAYTFWLADDMAMGGMDMTGLRMIPAGQGLMAPQVWPWQPIEFVYVFVMWTVMMVGMMTPSVAPMVLIYARVARKAELDGKPFAPTAWFAAGYLLIWTGFSALATTGQWGLERAALLNPMMESTNRILGSMVLIIAGLYQWTSLKDACLSACRSPLFFIQQHGGFRRDAAGSVLLGIKHGTYCVGCCWTLMGILFVGGVMNVLWIAAIALLVLAEKVVPAGPLIGRIIGTAFMAAGVWLLVIGAR
jgi:predicted metal-binding membrane protein